MFCLAEQTVLVGDEWLPCPLKYIVGKERQNLQCRCVAFLSEGQMQQGSEGSEKELGNRVSFESGYG